MRPTRNAVCQRSAHEPGALRENHSHRPEVAAALLALNAVYVVGALWAPAVRTRPFSQLDGIETGPLVIAAVFVDATTQGELALMHGAVGLGDMEQAVEQLFQGPIADALSHLGQREAALKEYELALRGFAKIGNLAYFAMVGKEALEQVAAAIHPHPTLSETQGAAAEVYYGTATDLYRPRREGRGK